MCLSFTPSYAQDLNLSDYTWKNRLLVLSSAENNSDAIQKQLEILLIGEYGGVKMRTVNHVSTEFLFSLIDGMPMRRSELKNRGH